MGETTYMGVQLKVQPMLVGSIFSITELHFTYVHATLRVLYLHNHCITLVLRVRHLNCSPCWLRLPTESLDDTAIDLVLKFLAFIFMFLLI